MMYVRSCNCHKFGLKNKLITFRFGFLKKKRKKKILRIYPNRGCDRETDSSLETIGEVRQ